MGNAVKFTPDGGQIRLSISEKPSNQAKVGCYEFVFEDNGIGMKEDFVKQIFNPFARATDGVVEHIQGTGLGMSISRNIVRMMGGDIKVESEYGVGSRFTVTIYLKLQDIKEVQYDKFNDMDVLVADVRQCRHVAVRVKACADIDLAIGPQYIGAMRCRADTDVPRKIGLTTDLEFIGW